MRDSIWVERPDVRWSDEDGHHVGTNGTVSVDTEGAYPPVAEGYVRLAVRANIHSWGNAETVDLTFEQVDELIGLLQQAKEQT